MNLTQIAGENVAAASTIAKALEEFIQRVTPSSAINHVGTTGNQTSSALFTRLNL